jgi:hypothetical protein
LRGTTKKIAVESLAEGNALSILKIIIKKTESFALRIEMEILFERNDQKDCSEKPGRRQRPKHFNCITFLISLNLNY